MKQQISLGGSRGLFGPTDIECYRAIRPICNEFLVLFSANIVENLKQLYILIFETFFEDLMIFEHIFCVDGWVAITGDFLADSVHQFEQWTGANQTFMKGE